MHFYSPSLYHVAYIGAAVVPKLLIMVIFGGLGFPLLALPLVVASLELLWLYLG